MNSYSINIRNGCFVVWSRVSRRSKDLAHRLGLHLITLDDRPPYFRASLETPRRLKGCRVVFCQLPPGPLVLQLAAFKRLYGYVLVADVHTGFLVYSDWRGWLLNSLFKPLLRYADLVLAHNPAIASLASRFVDPERVVVVYDPVPERRSIRCRPGFSIDKPFLLLPASWASDEPIDTITRDFVLSGLSERFSLVVTGDYRRNLGLLKRVLEFSRTCRGCVVLTGFVPDDVYAWLLENAFAVMAVTTREYTLLSALWEAVAYSKPFIVSYTKTLLMVLGYDYPCIYRVGEPETLRYSVDACIKRRGDVLNVIERLRILSDDSLAKLKERLAELVSG